MNTEYTIRKHSRNDGSDGRRERRVVPQEDKNDALLALLKQGFLFLHGEVDESMAEYVRDSLVVLTREPPKEGVLTVRIGSQGGDVQAGLEIHDLFMLYAMETGVRIEGLVVGQACSAAAMFLLQGCTIRYASENCRIMCHNALAIDIITEHDLKSVGWHIRMLRELETIKAQAIKILTRRTKKTEREILKLLARGQFLTAQEALAFGLLDGVLEFKFTQPEETESE